MPVLQWLEAHMLTCPSKYFLHVDCPGCGMQRSLLALLKGDIVQSWYFYPPVFFIIPTLLLLVLRLTLKTDLSLSLLKFSFILTSLVVVFNYIYKITTHQLL